MRKHLFLTLFFLFLSLTAQGEESAFVKEIPFLSETEFEQLANDLAPKVNLFADVWKENPAAEFYGGTSRDFLYWVKGKFRGVSSKREAREIAAGLRAQLSIDVRDFIVGDSDVDVIAESPLQQVRYQDYGIKKLDSITHKILDPSTVEGANEMHQGYIPAEKIRIRRNGIISQMGDGLEEIYSGRLSVHFSAPEEFAKTKFAELGINHPILLATRYIRLLGINYFNSYGQGVPNKEILLNIDPETVLRMREVIDPTLDSKTLQPFIARDKFRAWLNSNIQKAFRSYTNPTAALELERFFKIDELVARYETLEPINQYVFAKFRDEKTIYENLHREGIDPKKFFLEPMQVFPDGTYYHGTRTEEGFKGILFQGILPSDSGTADGGLYGVNKNNIQFAEKWGGSRGRLLGLEVKADARIVDITRGLGEEVWKRYQKSGKTLDQFADDFGVDIIRYPYDTEAYVVKNSSALKRPRGIHRQIFSFSKALEEAERVANLGQLIAFHKKMLLNSFNKLESETLFAATKPAELLHHLNFEKYGSEITALIQGKDVFSTITRTPYSKAVSDAQFKTVKSIADGVNWIRSISALEAGGWLNEDKRTEMLKQLWLRLKNRDFVSRPRDFEQWKEWFSLLSFSRDLDDSHPEIHSLQEQLLKGLKSFASQAPKTSWNGALGKLQIYNDENLFPPLVQMVLGSSKSQQEKQETIARILDVYLWRNREKLSKWKAEADVASWAPNAEQRVWHKLKLENNFALLKDFFTEDLQKDFPQLSDPKEWNELFQQHAWMTEADQMALTRAIKPNKASLENFLRVGGAEEARFAVKHFIAREPSKENVALAMTILDLAKARAAERQSPWTAVHLQMVVLEELLSKEQWRNQKQILARLLEDSKDYETRQHGASVKEIFYDLALSKLSPDLYWELLFPYIEKHKNLLAAPSEFWRKVFHRPGVWKGHEHLLFHILRQNRGDMYWQVKVALSSSEVFSNGPEDVQLYETPELALELVEKGDDFTVSRLLADALTNKPWKTHPYLLQLLQGKEMTAENLRGAWRKEKQKPEVRRRLDELYNGKSHHGCETFYPQVTP